MMMQKFYFNTDRELVKFHVFRVPGSTNGQIRYHKVKINIDALTPYFFPRVYLNKVESAKEIIALEGLTFPNIKKNQVALGQNPFLYLN